ncbi:hypothetical protein PtA15_12A197 [Puccinia triticina]|uniref:Uncharacterized protein n=1 Tax=Puccinia triticina TaxID=208348 RepID=A0ABY7CYC3_9BASI|nr:uncharacterized protein PtA15_12A197 [Puccinia triticina]WAQ90211.1 hypothetical protein PtA15_12A197 [Puccinia triticina]
MSDTAPPPSTQPGNGNAGAPPPSHDEAWISDLVDSLVPKFQAAGSTSAGDSAMRTDDEGKSTHYCRNAYPRSVPWASLQDHHGTHASGASPCRCHDPRACSTLEFMGNNMN